MSALDETDENIPEEGEEEEVKAIADEEEESEEEDEDDDEYGTVATELSHDRVELLINLFEALDRDNDGKLTVKDFRNLGEVMTGTRPTKASALAQLRRADLDDDDEVGKDEWLDFSSNLAKMDKLYFQDCMKSYIGKLKLLDDEKNQKIEARKRREILAEKQAQEQLDAYVKSSVK